MDILQTNHIIDEATLRVPIYLAHLAHFTIYQWFASFTSFDSTCFGGDWATGN